MIIFLTCRRGGGELCGVRAPVLVGTGSLIADLDELGGIVQAGRRSARPMALPVGVFGVADGRVGSGGGKVSGCEQRAGVGASSLYVYLAAAQGQLIRLAR